MNFEIRRYPVREAGLKSKDGACGEPARATGPVRTPGVAEVQDEVVELEKVQDRSDFARPADLPQVAFIGGVFVVLPSDLSED